MLLLAKWNPNFGHFQPTEALILFMLVNSALSLLAFLWICLLLPFFILFLLMQT